MSHITLDELLAAKEQRVLYRTRLQADQPGSCITLSVNIPGSEKDSPRVRHLFRYAFSRVEELFPVVHSCIYHGKAGPYAICAVSGKPARIKEKACFLETEKEYSRLLDLDVYDEAGKAVASPLRKSGRPCFICTEPAIICMREKRHTKADIQTAIEHYFTSFYADMSRHVSPSAAHYASLALEAILYEAASSPSPGLVDPVHTGSHKDMDFFTFQRSSAALAFHFARCAEAGLRHEGNPEHLLPVLRHIGMDAENDMFRATNGINTQKGLLFSMGLALGATGLLLREDNSVSPESLSALLQKMTQGIVERELGRPSPKTAGEKMFRDFGISGIRGEMEAGLPSVMKAGLPALKKALAAGHDCNRALIQTLVTLIATVDDTTILARSKKLETLHLVKDKAQTILLSGALDKDDWEKTMWKLDEYFVAQNLSPGGSADLLALTWFIYKICNKSSKLQKS